jgi:riboflavin kinase/FMN adenylyltransferase
MRTFRGFHHPDVYKACALTIGNFDGVHQGHQAMIRHLLSRAKALDVPSCVLTFEPHPRNYFAKRLCKAELAPARVSTFRDKLAELERCGVDQCVVLPFNEQLASLTPDAFVQSVLIQGLGAKFVLIGDDFKYGAKRAGDYTTLEQAGAVHGFEVARMGSFELNGVRVSSS